MAPAAAAEPMAPPKKTMDYLQSVAAARARCDAVLAAKTVDEPPPTDTTKTKNALSEAPSAASVRAVFPHAPKVKVIAELPDKDVPPPSLEECQDLLGCLLYTSPSPRDQRGSRMPSSA